MVKAKVFLWRISLLILFSSIFFSCKTVYDLRHVNFSSAYNPIQSFLFVHWKIIHISNDSSVLVVEVPLEQNNFQPKPTTFVVRLKWYESMQSISVQDSLEKTISVSPSSTYYHFEIPFALANNSQQCAMVQVIETSSLKSFEKIISVNKKPDSPDFVFLTRSATQEKYIFPYTTNETVFQLKNSSGADTFRVSYYSFSYQLAAPTFFSYVPQKFPEKVDSVFIYTTADTFRLNKEGVYWFVSSKNPAQNFCVLNARKDFPKVSEAKDLAASVRYITKNDEFTYMSEKNVKERVDSFWLEKSGTLDHAKDMIRRYYTRVQFANEFFTTYQEGWQTDRGLVYIIFGAPDEVYFDADAEWWGYHSRGNRGALRYKFVREENPFNSDAWELIRNSNYFDSWNRQGYAWRHGLAD